MVVPNLLHKVSIEITQISKATTFYDDDAREPIQHAARVAPVVVDGQVNWLGDRDGGQEQQANKGGASIKSTGYILFRYVDLNAKGITLRHEDRISKIASQDYDLYIHKLVPMGHYKAPTLVRAYFSDRQPSKVA